MTSNNFSIPVLSSWQEAYSQIEEQFSFNLSQNQKALLENFYVLLQKANENMNLTKHISLSDFLTFHLFDTACILSCLNLQESFKTYLDLGSGCGVPGIILHILLSELNPNLQTTLCDSRAKRAQYLQETINALNLNQNILVICSQAEKMAKQKIYQKHFSLITARAFAKPPETLKIVWPFLALDGQFVYQTSISLKQDENYLKALRNKKIQIEKYFLIADKNRYFGAW